MALGLVAVTAFEFGFGKGGVWAIAAGFAAIIAAFAGHIIVNAVYGLAFSPRETALGLVLFGVALLASVLASLLVPGFAARNFAVLSAGFVALFAAVVFYMVTHYGIRRSFDAFDVIRDFRPRGLDGGSK